jgi:hypothetical protein
MSVRAGTRVESLRAHGDAIQAGYRRGEAARVLGRTVPTVAACMVAGMTRLTGGNPP